MRKNPFDRTGAITMESRGRHGEPVEMGTFPKEERPIERRTYPRLSMSVPRERRVELLREEFPEASDEQLDVMDAQQPYLDEVERVRAAAAEAGMRLSYGQAMDLAKERNPQAYGMYLNALGRKW